jgi:CheY-like chemotaxis protein
MRVVSDGRDLLRIITGEEPNAQTKNLELIILDLNLPRHDGIEILERLRHTDLAHVPVVVLTSSDSPRDRQLAASLGAARFLRKPSGLEQFLSLGAVFKDLLHQREEAGNERGSAN